MTNETEQLRRLVDAREKATKGDWKAIDHENKNAFEGNLVVTPNNMDDAVCTIWTCDANKETEENAEFIALAGSTDLRAEAMGMMVEALQYTENMADADLMFCLQDYNHLPHETVKAIARSVCNVIGSRNRTALSHPAVKPFIKGRG